MVFKRLPTGMLASNCYILGDNGEGIIIDPGAKSQDILDVVEQLGLKIKYIILTHAHVDHIISMDEIRYKLGVEVLIHEEDADSLSDLWRNGSNLFGIVKTFNSADVLLKDGDIISVGGLELEIIHTPGHTPGGICIKVDDKVFTGDTLFRMSIGRTDLGNGDSDDLMNSIREKLMKLDDKIMVYPGHGTATTIGYERKNNPFF
ncbi:MAG TPA: MBL fold metallo-hydrolase [Clostridiales bacterium]|nr:MBL fold metallo-hydrolase [Clostridiales bacterium]